MTCVHPRVSTAVSFLMIALFLLIFVTPIDRTIVTTAASPSGMAATASEMATMKVSRIPENVTVPVVTYILIRSMAKITTQMPSTR